MGQELAEVSSVMGIADTSVGRGEDARIAGFRIAGLLYLAVIIQEKPGARITGAGLIQRAALKADRSGTTYAALTVVCADGGVIQARWWDAASPGTNCPRR